LTSRRCRSQKASEGTGGRPAWWDSKQHQASTPQNPPPMRPPPADLVLYSTSPVRKNSAEIVFSRYWASALASLPELSAVVVHGWVIIGRCFPPHVAPNTGMYGHCECWHCTLQRLLAILARAAQGIAPPLRAGGLDCASPSTSLRKATTRALSLMEAHSTGGIREC